MLAVVTSLTNCIMDEILQELYQSHKKLARHILQLQRLTEQDSLTLGSLQEKQTRNQERDPDEGTDDELSTSIDTLAIRRQTVHSRRIRPVSAFLSVSELELDRVTEDDSVSGRLSTSTTSSQHSRSLETLTDLPTEGLKLEHQTRVRPRPRRNNRQPPTKPNNVPFAEKGEENGAGSKLDEGLEDFYSWNMTMDDAEAPQAGPQTSQPPSAPVPKKRKSRRRGGLFRFIRGRSVREESSAGGTASRPASRGREGEVAEDQDDRAARTPGWAPDRQEEGEAPREARAGQIAARPVQGIPLPGMGGSRPTFHQDCPPPADRCYMKTSTSSSSSDRLEECGQPFVPLLPSKKPAWGRKSEAEDEQTPEVDRRREMRDRGDVRGLPPPPPPPPQEAKPIWSGSRPIHHVTTAGGGDVPRDSSPARDPRHVGSRARGTEPDRCRLAGMDGGSRDEGAKAGRRILVPPTSRIPGMEKRPKDPLPTAPVPPAPPPADCKPRLEEEEEEALARGGEGGERKPPPPARGAHREEDGEEEEGGGGPGKTHPWPGEDGVGWDCG
ncbi:uncharacterized protein [Scyliorhinus torazame]|uniref:uncharacterized protein n=1 Tax=Scyliorhinus torazame TaxID=75743 RepID=UPI003B5AEDEA